METQESRTITLEAAPKVVKIDPELDFGDENQGNQTQSAPKNEDAAPSETSGVEILRQQLEAKQREAEDARKARIEAENLARQREFEAKNAVVYAQDSQITAFDNAIAGFERDAEMLEERAAAALERGEYQAAAKIQREMAKIESKLEFLNKGKFDLQEKLEVQRQNLTPPERIVYEGPKDPVEAYIQNLAPVAKDWIRAHPEVVTDDTLRNLMTGAHYEALGMGLKPNTQEYFGHIENKLGYGDGGTVYQPEMQQRAEPTPQYRPQGRTPMASAPVSRSASPTVSRNGNRMSVTLTPAMREAAEIAGMSEEEYAAEMVRLANQGKIKL
jgi:DNA-binding protein YbaB